MLSRVDIICFTASYAVTLVLELSRLFFRSGIRGAIMLGFAGAGLFAHTVYLYYRAASATGSPLSSSQDWCMVAAWGLTVAYLYLTVYHPKAAFGLFILPLVLGLIGVGTYLADPAPFPREPASRVWGIIHGASILLATVAVLVGFAAGLMYLGQAYRLKHKLPPRRGLRLPSLEWLRRTNSRTIGIAALMLGAGILSGVILNLIRYEPNSDRLPWSDPVVLITLGMFGWLILSGGIGVFYQPAREGRRVAFLTVFSFVFLVAALAVVLLGDTQHGGLRREGGRRIEKGRRLEGSGLRPQGSGTEDERHGDRGAGATPSEVCSVVRDTDSDRAGTDPRLDGALGTPGLRPVGLTIVDSTMLLDALPASPHCRLITLPSPLFNAHCPLCTTHCPLPTAHYPPPTSYYPPLPARCLPLTVRASR